MEAKSGTVVQIGHCINVDHFNKKTLMVMLVFIFICVNKLLIVSRLSCLVHLSVPFFGRFYVEICRKKRKKKSRERVPQF